jgi:hypothetical protein
MRGQTGIAIRIGGAVVYARSMRQKINSVSSTETEIVAVSQKFSEPLWLLQFLEDLPFCADADCAAPGPILLEQDNQSTMKLWEMGTAQKGNSRHIQARHFWIADLIQKGMIVVAYVSTDDIVADVFTKPLSHAVFSKHVVRLGLVSGKIQVME